MVFESALLIPRSGFPLLDRLALLQESLQPCQHSGPPAICLSKFGMGAKAAVTNSHEGSRLRRLKFPSYLGLYVACPSCTPGRGEQPWRIDLQVFTRDFKWLTIAIYAYTSPLSADAQIGFEFCASIDTRLAPPLHNLGGVNECLKYALRRSDNLNLANDFVCVGCLLRHCHIFLRCAFFGRSGSISLSRALPQRTVSGLTLRFAKKPGSDSATHQRISTVQD